MRRFFWARAGVCACLAAAAGCSKKPPEGLPPATDWQASPETGPANPGEPPAPFAPPPGMTGVHGGELDDDPHAGLDTDETDDPHAGVDVTQLGLAAPDPDRAIDPSHRVAGMIVVDPKTRARVTPGTAVFVIVKRAGADGAPSGSPLAVDKLTWRNDGVPFALTEAQAMVGGTELTGDVVVTARYDQDSDALTKQPGDLTGQIRVKIPADHIKLSLDTVLP
jgi:hypothetical protein